MLRFSDYCKSIFDTDSPLSLVAPPGGSFVVFDQRPSEQPQRARQRDDRKRELHLPERQRGRTSQRPLV